MLVPHSACNKQGVPKLDGVGRDLKVKVDVVDEAARVRVQVRALDRLVALVVHRVDGVLHVEAEVQHQGAVRLGGRILQRGSV